jgi:hypothetical protein
MDILCDFDQEIEKEKKLYSNIFDLLSYEKINFNGIFTLNPGILFKC